MTLVLDHIAVAAPDLDSGVTAVAAALGLTPGPGGRHDRMRTQNRLLGLGDTYLEVIAAEPGPGPGRPRWFDLDRFSGPPRLTTWICRTEDLDAMVRALPQAGEILEFARGDLRWRMAVPADGILPFDGLFPALIQWEGPMPRLPDSGARLHRLTVTHPAAADLAARLAPWLADPRLRIESGSPRLSAELETPAGLRRL